MPSAREVFFMEMTFQINATTEELTAWAQAQAHSAANGAPGGLQRAGACPRCGRGLKYIARHPRLGFVVWCDTVNCITVQERG